MQLHAKLCKAVAPNVASVAEAAGALYTGCVALLELCAAMEKPKWWAASVGEREEQPPKMALWKRIPMVAHEIALPTHPVPRVSANVFDHLIGDSVRLCFRRNFC